MQRARLMAAARPNVHAAAAIEGWSSAGRSRAGDWIASTPAPLLLILLIGASTAWRAWEASRVATPWVNSDEITYSQLGRSLYLTGHFRILGQPVGYLSALYPALIGLPLALHDVGVGYALLKMLQAFVISLTAVPIYLWSRTLVSRAWALTAAALTLALPGLAYSSLVMSEVAFMPVMTLSAWAIAVVVAQPSLRNQGLMVFTIALAVATRVQAVILVPVFVTSVILKALLEGDVRRRLQESAPSVMLLAGVTTIWIAYHVEQGNGAMALGGYQGVIQTSVDPATAARWIMYHAADVLLMTAVVPACAFALVALRTWRDAEADRNLRAYTIVAASFTLWMVVEVGTFASQYVLHLAERNLLPVAPVLLIGFVVWLHRDLYRPRAATTGIAASALALLVALPFSDLVLHALPDAFMIVPLERLQEVFGGFDLRLAVIYVALPLLAMFVYLPRRLRWVMPSAVAAVFVGTSFIVGNAIADQSRFLSPRLLGHPKTWVDSFSRGPAAYLYAGEVDWNPVFENIFWNRQIRRVYAMPGPLVPGPLPQVPVRPTAAGVLEQASNATLAERYIVADESVVLDGTRIATASTPRLALWHLRGQPSVSAWLPGVYVRSEFAQNRRLFVVGEIRGAARFVFYRCSGGLLKATLAAPEQQNVTVSRASRTVRRFNLVPGESRTVVLEGRPIPGRSASASRCEFAVTTDGGPVEVQPLEFVR
jgi:hypothetical protein